MTSDNRVLVVIPAYNEAGAIGGVIEEIRREAGTVDVLVVDDGSADATVQEARKAGAIVACLPYNLGVGGARRLGFRYGHDNGYDVVVQFDADGQHDPRYIPRLVEALDNADVVIGARFAGEGDYRVRGPRAWAMSLLSAVLSRMAKAKLTDTTSGFRAANRRGIDLYSANFPVEYLGDTVETIVQAVRNDLTVRQVPVAMRSRAAGVPSHSPVKATVYLGRAFAILLLALIRR